MAIRSPSTEQRPVADVVLEATTPFGRRWSSTQIPASTRKLYDPERLLAAGGVITVHAPRNRHRLFLLKIKGRDREYAVVNWLGRGG